MKSDRIRIDGMTASCPSSPGLPLVLGAEFISSGRRSWYAKATMLLLLPHPLISPAVLVIECRRLRIVKRDYFEMGVQDSDMVALPDVKLGFYGVRIGGDIRFDRQDLATDGSGFFAEDDEVRIELDCDAHSLRLESPNILRRIKDLPALSPATNKPVIWRLAVVLDGSTVTLLS